MPQHPDHVSPRPNKERGAGAILRHGYQPFLKEISAQYPEPVATPLKCRSIRIEHGQREDPIGRIPLQKHDDPIGSQARAPSTDGLHRSAGSSPPRLRAYLWWLNRLKNQIVIPKAVAQEESRGEPIG